MMGKMGYDIVVSQLTEKELEFSQKALENYKRINPVIWKGNLYRLQNPWDKPFASLVFSNENQDHAVMFNYLTTNRFDTGYNPTPIKLKGLSPNKKYSVKEINLFPGTTSSLKADLVYTGDYLMNIGINPELSGRRSSVILELNEVK